MQFHQATGAKVKPAVGLLDAGDADFVAAPLTSQARHSDYNLAMEDWRVAGLNVASYIRVHKVSVLAKADTVRSLGLLAEGDREALVLLLCRAFCQRASGA